MPDTNYNKEKQCIYRDEHYSVRDNGAVLRHAREGKRVRPLDNQWTYGKLNKHSGHLEIVSVPIHRIVATAYHGEPKKANFVVDHKDTNRQNNRPQNLRWLSRFENIVSNPITVKRIELVCGCTIEEFLADIDQYKDVLSNSPSDISWMRTVSAEEGAATLRNLQEWAESDNKPSGLSLGEWIYTALDSETYKKIDEVFDEIEKKIGISRKEVCSPIKRRGHYYDARVFAAKQLHKKLHLTPVQIGRIMNLSPGLIEQYLVIISDSYSQDYEEVHERELQLRIARTDRNILQENWHTESELPCCPQEPDGQSIKHYANNLTPGCLFFVNKNQSAYLVKSAVIDNGERLVVMYEVKNNSYSDKRWGIMSIQLIDGVFLHRVITNYNDTLQHYWLPDTENHFNCIVNGGTWKPQYNSQKEEITGQYLESVIRTYPDYLE